MRFKKLHDAAERIDLRLDEDFNRGRKNRMNVRQILEEFLPDGSRYLGRGAYKSSFLVFSNKRKLVLKVGREHHISRDTEIVFLARRSGMKRCTLKYYWKTKYCALQKYCRPLKDVIAEIKRKGKRLGLRDIRTGNIGLLDGRLVAYDM